MSLFEQLFELLERSKVVMDGLVQATRNLAKATPDRVLRVELERANKVATDHVRSLNEILRRAQAEEKTAAEAVLGSVRAFQATEQAFHAARDAEAAAQKALRTQEQTARLEIRALKEKFENAQIAVLFYGEHHETCAAPPHASKVHEACTCGLSNALLGEQLPPEVTVLREVMESHLRYGAERRQLLQLAESLGSKRS